MKCQVMQHYIYANKLENGNVTIGASTFDGKEANMSDVKEATAAYSLVEWRINHLTGRILTLVDASMTDRDQKKAFKDIVRNYVAEEFSFFADTLLPQSMKDALAPFEDMSDEEFAEWEKNNPPVDIEEVIAPGK